MAEPISLRRGDIFLGDDVKLMDRNLSMFENLRVVTITYDPTNDLNMRIEFAEKPSQWYGSGIENNVTNDYDSDSDYYPEDDPGYDDDYDPGGSTDPGGDSSYFRVQNGVPQWYNPTTQTWSNFTGDGSVIIERWI